MQGKEYQELAMRTNDGKSEKRLWQNTQEHNFYKTADLLNGVLGLTGEAGEVADLVKKGIFHQKGIDETHLKKEIGDVMWYVAMICESCGFSLDDVLETNVEKLKARYPEGFDVKRANNRAKGDI